MFENDYIMRLIHEIIRMLLKLLFGVDVEKSEEYLMEYEEESNEYLKLKQLVDKGQIDEAENELFTLLQEKSKASLKLGILFYSYLNQKSDAFLGKHDFSRDEILYGIKRISIMYGFDSVIESFENKEM